MVNPLIPKKASSIKFLDLPHNAAILEDYDVKKSIRTQEGTITKEASDDYDIVNKHYVDTHAEFSFTGINTGPYDYVEYTYTGTQMTHAVYKLAGVTIATADLTYDVKGSPATITLDKSGVITVDNYAYTYDGGSKILTITKS